MTARLSPTARRYLLEFGLAMAAYAVVTVVAGLVVRSHPDAGWRFVVAATPVLPALAGAVALLRHTRRVDELERRVQFEAVTFGALVTGLLTLAYGFLDEAGAPRLSMVWVLPLLVATWGIGVALARWRYR